MSIFSSCTTAPGHQGAVTDHFDGERFYNRHPFKKGLKDLLRWQLNKDKKTWPEMLENRPMPIIKSQSEEDFLVTFINHATVLIQVDGKTILTDPIWSDRTSPVSWAGPKRHRRPGIDFDVLPKIDVVLISHNHYDHLDLPTLKKLVARDAPLIIAGLGNKQLFDDVGISNTVELDWWQQHGASGMQFHFVPSQHFSGRSLRDRNRTLWGGFVVESKKKKIYFAGDTGYSDYFKEIQQRFQSFDLALIPIGAYEPRWFMRPGHVDPLEAVQAHLDLKAKFSVGIHWGTFQLTDEGIDAPVLELEQAKIKLGVPKETFVALDFGETRKLD